MASRGKHGTAKAMVYKTRPRPHRVTATTTTTPLRQMEGNGGKRRSRIISMPSSLRQKKSLLVESRLLRERQNGGFRYLPTSLHPPVWPSSFSVETRTPRAFATKSTLPWRVACSAVVSAESVQCATLRNEMDVWLMPRHSLTHGVCVCVRVVAVLCLLCGAVQPGALPKGAIVCNPAAAAKAAGASPAAVSVSFAQSTTMKRLLTRPCAILLAQPLQRQPLPGWRRVVQAQLSTASRSRAVRSTTEYALLHCLCTVWLEGTLCFAHMCTALGWASAGTNPARVEGVWDAGRCRTSEHWQHVFLELGPSGTGCTAALSLAFVRFGREGGVCRVALPWLTPVWSMHTLQCLTYTAPLFRTLDESNHIAHCQTSGFCVMCEVIRHMKLAIARPRKVVSASRSSLTNEHLAPPFISTWPGPHCTRTAFWL